MPGKMLMALFALSSGTTVYAGPNDRMPPEAYLNPIDQQIARSGQGIEGRPYPCAEKATDPDGQGAWEISAIDRCVRMTESRHWSGVWRYEFEGSTFCQGAALDCRWKKHGEKVFLAERVERPGQADLLYGIYRVEFRGRKTMFKGSFGHLGLYDQLVQVDDMLTIRKIADLPDPRRTMVKGRPAQ